jgi:hypothetical protein
MTMSELSPRLALPLIQPSQAQKHVTHNEAIDRLDALVQISVVAFEATTPPATPAEGQCWALGALPSGAWAGKGGQLARWRNGGWEFITPVDGWVVWGQAEGEIRVRSGGTFAGLSGGVPSLIANLSGLGIGTTPDAANRLAVASEAALFSHDGAGHQLKINKAAVSDTASLLFQTGFSGRAEFGLAGSDNFSVKVSADGAAFTTALVADAASGQVGLPVGLALGGLAADPAEVADGSIWMNATAGQIRARIGGVVRNLVAADMAVLTPVAGDYMMTTNGAGNSTTTQAGSAGRMDLFPFMPRVEIITNGLAVNVTTLAAGALGRIVVYSADANGRPDQRLLETADLDLGVAGVRVASAALTLRQGVTYWFGIRHSAGPTMSVWQASGTPDLNGGQPSTQARKILRRTLAFGTPAPAVWGFAASELSNGSACAIWLRVA